MKKDLKFWVNFSVFLLWGIVSILRWNSVKHKDHCTTVKEILDQNKKIRSSQSSFLFRYKKEHFLLYKAILLTILMNFWANWMCQRTSKNLENKNFFFYTGLYILAEVKNQIIYLLTFSVINLGVKCIEKLQPLWNFNRK